MDQNANLLHAVLDGTTDVIFVKDLAGKYLFINRTGARLLGKSIDEVIGLDDSVFFDSRHVADMRAIDERVAAEAISLTYERPGPPQSPDKTFLLTKSPYRDSAGKVQGVIGIARDISPQRRAAEVLSESAERFRTLASRSPTGIYEADARGGFIYFNDKCCDLFELSREELMRNEGWGVIHPDDVPRVAQGWERFLTNDEEYLNVEFRLLFSAQRIKHIIATSLPLFDEQGNKTGYIGNLIDITEQRRAQRELELANQELESRVRARTAELLLANEQLTQEMAERARTEERLREQQAQLAHALRVRTLGEMAAELAHEVNQPLAAISHYVHGTIQRLEMGVLTMLEVGSTLKFIARESERAAEIIRRTKRFASIQQPCRAPLDLHKLIHESLKMLAYKVREQKIQVELKLADRLPEAGGDEMQVQQVIVNLLRNAIEAIGGSHSPQRVIEVSTLRGPQRVEFVVADSGPGLQSGQPERIFETFYTTKAEGLGLGLAISRDIIEAHGGRLWADLTNSRGATFRFTLPVWNDETAPESAPRSDSFRGR
ncbi:MAG: PAS domain S-box protein [Pirellulaceae bacterium]